MSDGTSHTLPGVVLPGQRTIMGTRMPPSYSIDLPPRSGRIAGEDRVAAVVGDEDHSRVVGEFQFVEFVEDRSDTAVHAFDQTCVGRVLCGRSALESFAFFVK